MSKRLQVLLEEADLRDLQRAARKNRMTLSEWVRQAIREARRREPRVDAEKKLAVIRSAARHSFPVGDIDEMLSQIESGYLAEGDR